MPSILVVSGPSEGLYQPLGKHTIVIGRDGVPAAGGGRPGEPQARADPV